MGTLEDVIASPDYGYQRGQGAPRVCLPVRTTAPNATVLDAVEVMCRYHVRAVIVGEPSDPLGIVCERDILERVVLPQRDPATTLVVEIMTTPIFQLPLGCTPQDALDYLQLHHVHQVPVAGEEGLVGVVSSSDLRAWALRNLESEVDALISYVVFGR